MFTIKITDKLALKLLEKQDASELFRLVDGSRVYLREWLPWVDYMVKEADYEPVIDMWLKQFASDNGFQTGIEFEGQLVGMIGFHEIDWPNKTTSMGYWLGETHQGYGIMTAATTALINLAFERYELNRIEIKCGVKNYKSRRIPEKLGFIKEGIIRDGEYLYNHFHDCVLYSLLRREWNSLSN